MSNLLDFTQNHVCPSNNFIDKLKYSKVVTFWGGFHNYTEESGHKVQKALMPNFDLILFPHKALKEEQHFGLGTYFTNTLAPLATILNGLGGFLYDEIVKGKDKEEPYVGLAILYALLWIVRAPLDLVVLAIDFAKMLTIYALIAASAVVASPVLIPLLIVRRHRLAKSREFTLDAIPNDDLDQPFTEFPDMSPDW